MQKEKNNHLISEILLLFNCNQKALIASYFNEIIFLGICQIHECENITSYCFPTPGNGSGHECRCNNGYTMEPGVKVKCIDYCEAGLNHCDKETTRCVATPGIGPNYRCDCLNEETQIKQAYYRCVSPLPVGETRKSGEGITKGNELISILSLHEHSKLVILHSYTASIL